mgnify:CR=1 FL=1
MKNYLVITLLLLAIVSCKQEKENKDYSKENLNITTSVYPDDFSKVLDAHGGIDKWNEQQKLIFEIVKADGNEKTTTALKARKSLIETNKYAIGFNGKDVWLKEKDTTKYEGKPKFYYNLMFYFYAMPFVLADDGINYDKADPLLYEGKKYPGIKITYETGVGESPEDEYILYYDSETNKMAWLGYTVTYFSKEKSKDFHFIKYEDWQTVDGLMLPATLKWYNAEGFEIGEMRNALSFTNVYISKTKPDNTVFEKPNDANFVE